MALTIAIEGKGVIANSDALTNDTGGTATGDWGKVGNGTLSLSSETYYYGSSCVALAVSNEHSALYFDLGVGNELDFDVAGTEEGQYIYMWIFLPTPGLQESIVNGGTKIRLYTDLSNYRDFMISASDDTNGLTGDWKCFVIDPTKTGSVTDTGTYDAGSIQYIGVDYDATAVAKGDNVFIDQIAVGSGLRITGTSTTGWKDVVDYCTDRTNRAWGMMQEREGIYYAYGNIYIGDATSQAAAVSFADSGRVIQFGDTEYYISAAWATTMATTANGITIEDHTSYTTTFSDGVIVGTDNGRSGSTVIGNANQNVSLDLYGGNNAASVTTLYGTSIKDCTGTINAGNDADHKFLGCSFIGNSQFDPVGAPVIRNSTFAETTDLDSALLWNSNIDIQDCSFIANTTGAGIEHDVSGSFNYTDLIFSGNSPYDILNSISATTCDSYSESNQDADYSLSVVDFGRGQSFAGDNNVLSEAVFYVKKTGSPTGNAYAELYAITGTSGTDAKPTGTALATSEVFDVSTLTTSYALISFPFFDRYTVASGTDYAIVLRYFDAGASDYLLVGADSTTPTHSGNGCVYSFGAWSNMTQDFCFYVYTDSEVVINATDSDPSTYENTGTPPGVTTILTSVPVKVTVKDKAGDIIQNVQTAVHTTAERIEILNADTNASGIAETTYAGTTPVEVEVRCRKASSGTTRYKAFSTVQTVQSNTGLDLAVTMIEDTNNNATS